MTEDRERWALIDGIFSEALERPPTERAEFIATRCGGDASLVAEVNALLEASKDPSFLANAADLGSLRSLLREAADSSARADENDPLLGVSLGPYRIIRAIGQGGMGNVYLAERTEGFEQQVAIKTLRRGIDTDEVVQRFLAERQILAQLAHPNVARLFDGGTTPDGRPYFVMEYVHGQSITQYADDEKLGLAARLDLFKTVASAVHHAHQHLVVHRDLKPSNVFVNHQGVVKLLDFGIARLIGSEHRWGQTRTSTGFRVLTPAYAAPEQVARGPVTTATDVYQLGALFYELMTGVRPFPSDLSEPELEARIMSHDPDPPSKATGRTGTEAAQNRRFTSVGALAHALQGDLDVIAAKALSKEPERRYGTVEGMAEDVRRHLAGRPISARPPSTAYHFGRFVRRNRWFLPTCVAASLALLVYVGTTVRHNRALTLERDRAEAVTNFVTGLFNSANPWTGGVGADVTVREALDAGARRAELEFGDQPEIQARLLEVIGSSYYWLNRGDQALEWHTKAVALREQVNGDDALETLKARHMLALSSQSSGDADSALAIDLAVLSTLEPRTDDASLRFRAEVLGDIAWTYWRYSDFDAALERFAEADTAFAALTPLEPAGHGEMLRHFSRALAQAGRPEEGLPVIRRSVEMLAAALPADHIELAAARQDLGSAYSNAGLYQESLDALDAALAVFERQLEPDDPNVLSVRANRAFTLMEWGRMEDAKAAYEKIVELYEKRSDTPEKGMVDAIQNLAVLANRQGDSEAAVALGLRAHGLYEQVLGEHYLVAFPLLTVSQIQLDEGRYAGALANADKAYQTLTRTLPEGHFATAVALCRRGRARVRTGRSPQGISDLEAALASLRAAPPSSAQSYIEECDAALGEATRS